MFSLTGFGAASTKSLASFKPRPVIVLTSFNTAILLAPADAKITETSEDASSAASPAAGAAATADEAKALANLPSREEIYAKMLGCINSPATGIANSMNAVITQLVRTLDAVKEKLPA